jgi:FkbM family methyltransferase
MTDNPYDDLQELYFGANAREVKELEALHSMLRGASTFVDVGAALGQYTYFAAKAMGSGKVAALEADPARFQRLTENCQRWQLEFPRVEFVPLQVAATDKRGETEFHVAGAVDFSGGLFPVPSTDTETEWTRLAAKAETLDHLFPTPPDVVKLDVEGGEYRVLIGSDRLLREAHTRFFVEVHPWGDPTLRKRPSDVFRLFWHYKYDCTRIHHHWLFSPTQSRAKAAVKNYVFRTVYDHPALKDAVKRVVG